MGFIFCCASQVDNFGLAKMWWTYPVFIAGYCLKDWVVLRVQKYRYKSYAEAANFYCLVPLIEKQKTVL
jgi:hypothetical protein